MAKSMRSKIKRKFRTELRKKIGVPHQAIQEAKIQENLKRAIESQGTLATTVCYCRSHTPHCFSNALHVRFRIAILQRASL